MSIEVGKARDDPTHLDEFLIVGCHDLGRRRFLQVVGNAHDLVDGLHRSVLEPELVVALGEDL